MIFVTGGCGFIGSNFINYYLDKVSGPVVNIDALTYAGNIENLTSHKNNPNYIFSKTDILNKAAIENLFKTYKPKAILHFAAESHVDRSILGPDQFIQTNILGTYNLLEVTKAYLKSNNVENFRFIHVSTDEVFGSLGSSDPAFTEDSPYKPNSPYSASKASSDHLVRSYFHTYKLPVITTNCSNNYGPLQFPEKLIPVIIESCLANKNIPIYGDGKNVRDWLYVEDHCRALMTVLQNGVLGQTYNIGGQCEKSNLEVVDTVCSIMDELRPKADKASYSQLKKFVQDRPGHDWRYAIDISKIKNELGWKPEHDFTNGIKKTILWYLDNQKWLDDLKSRSN